MNLLRSRWLAWLVGVAFVCSTLDAAQDVKTVNGLAIASVKVVNDLAIASVKTINGTDNTAGGATYLARDQFNASGSDLTWTDTAGSGTFNVDYTTVALEGAQSLYSDQETRYCTWTGTDSEIYVAWMFRLKSDGSQATPIWSFRNSSGTILATVRLFFANPGFSHIQLVHSGDTTNAQVARAFVVDTTYAMKVVYNNGSGANGVWKVYVSEWPFTSWTLNNNVSNASDTAQCVRFSTDTQSRFCIMDDIRINPTADGGDTY